MRAPGSSAWRTDPARTAASTPRVKLVSHPLPLCFQIGRILRARRDFNRNPLCHFHAPLFGFFNLPRVVCHQSNTSDPNVQNLSGQDIAVRPRKTEVQLASTVSHPWSADCVRTLFGVRFPPREGKPRFVPSSAVRMAVPTAPTVTSKALNPSPVKREWIDERRCCISQVSPHKDGMGASVDPITNNMRKRPNAVSIIRSSTCLQQTPLQAIPLHIVERTELKVMSPTEVHNLGGGASPHHSGLRKIARSNSSRDETSAAASAALDRPRIPAG